MHLAHFVLITVLAWSGPSADDLVSKLGSPRFSEREEAATALRALGQEALPVLRLSKQAEDLEIRTRVRALIEEIETNLMIQPTLVRLNFQDQPVIEVARQIGEQANVSIHVFENNLGLRDRRVTLMESEPVPFWKALDELCREGSLQLNPGMQIVGLGPANRLPVINLYPTALPPPPSSISGPFRVTVMNVVDHRERNFQPMIQNAPVLGPNGRQLIATDTRSGVTIENFSASLSVMSEPRISVAMDGPIKVSEAVDDRGNVLSIPEPGGNIQHAAYSGMGMNHGNGAMILTLPVGLKMPERPGKVIQRLKATIPVVVMARKDDPLIVPLNDDSKGKTFENEQIRIKLNDIKQEAGQPFVALDLTVKLLQSEGTSPVQEYIAFRAGQGNSQNQIEIVDDQGRPSLQWFSSQTHPAEDGIRMNVQVRPTEGVGQPAQIRYYDLSKTPTEIEVDLKDIPLF